MATESITNKCNKNFDASGMIRSEVGHEADVEVAAQLSRCYSRQSGWLQFKEPWRDQNRHIWRASSALVQPVSLKNPWCGFYLSINNKTIELEFN